MKTLLRHRRWIFGTVLVILAGTLVTYFAAPRRYTASASVWLDNGLATGSEGAQSADQAVRRNAEIRILASPYIAARVVDKLGLADGRGAALAGGGRPASDQDRARAIALLVDGVTVRPRGASAAVVASYTGTDPVVATGIVNQLVDQYVAYRRYDGGRALDELRGRADAARDEMIRTRAAASAYRGATTLIGADQDTGELRQEAARLNRQLAQARLRTAGGDAANDAEASTLRDLRTQLSQLTADRTQLLERYGHVHPEIVVLNRRIAQVNREIASEEGGSGSLLALARLTQDRVRTQAEAIRKAAEQRTLLEASAKSAANRYGLLIADLRRLETLRTRSGGAYVISHARIPSSPSVPDPWLFAAAGLLAAILVSGIGIGIREWHAPGFRTPQAAEGRLGIPVIGSVPDISEVPGALESGIDPIDLVVSYSGSNFSAALKDIHLRLGLGPGAAPRSIAVSSAVAAEGKTTVAIALARSAALSGMRVLLIDCDVRRPSASQLLAPHAEVGLADVLEGRAELSQALTRDATSGIWFLASRQGGPTTNGLVGSQAMMDLIARLAPDYDLIVFDTAPVLALAETRVVAGFADSVLLVARWRRTPIRATQIAHDTFRRADVKVTALALTRVGA